jgi:hypothetical protein
VNSDDLIGAILRGDPGCAEALAVADPRSLLDEARREGVLPLVAERVADWPADPALQSLLQAEASGFAAADLARERELRKALDGLAIRGVRPILFKGGALAYTHYARPDLRPRDDSDLLVRSEVRATAHHTLIGLGYRPPRHVAGELVSYQGIYEREVAGVVVHTIDLHWRVANPQLFAEVLSFDEINASAVAIPALGASARGPSNPHALFLACVHRVAHHRDEKLLIWIFDIHLIASRLTPAEWRVFLDLAERRKMLTICRQGLHLARDRFGTVVPPAVASDPRFSADRAPVEPSAAFLGRDRAQLSTFLSDVRALPSWSDRGRLVFEHLCPSSDYMRHVYAPRSRAPLPALYVWRACRGAWRWIARA